MNPSRPFPYPKSRKLKPEELPEVYRALRRHFGHQDWWPGETPFEVMVGAILTQNTAWSNLEKAIANLRQAGVLSPEALRKISKKRLAALIRPAGYFNIKAERLKSFIQFFFKEYGGRLDRMRKERGTAPRTKLLSVKGVGPETADSMLLYALNRPIFVIDAYTKRIFARHRMMNFSESYDVWQKVFMSALPRQTSLYNDFHAQIVALGKALCKTSKPLCDYCPLSRYL